MVQILNWGGSYYLPAVLGKHIVGATGWSYAIVIGGLSVGLGISGLSSIFVGRRIEAHGGRPVLVFASLVLALGQMLLGAAPIRRSISPPGSCSASAWARGSMMRRSPRSDASTGRARDERSRR